MEADLKRRILDVLEPAGDDEYGRPALERQIDATLAPLAGDARLKVVDAALSALGDRPEPVRFVSVVAAWAKYPQDQLQRVGALVERVGGSRTSDQALAIFHSLSLIPPKEREPTLRLAQEFPESPIAETLIGLTRYVGLDRRTSAVRHLQKVFAQIGPEASGQPLNMLERLLSLPDRQWLELASMGPGEHDGMRARADSLCPPGASRFLRDDAIALLAGLNRAGQEEAVKLNHLLPAGMPVRERLDLLASLFADEPLPGLRQAFTEQLGRGPDLPARELRHVVKSFGRWHRAFTSEGLDGTMQAAWLAQALRALPWSMRAGPRDSESCVNAEDEQAAGRRLLDRFAKVPQEAWPGLAANLGALCLEQSSLQDMDGLAEWLCRMPVDQRQAIPMAKPLPLDAPLEPLAATVMRMAKAVVPDVDPAARWNRHHLRNLAIAAPHSAPWDSLPTRFAGAAMLRPFPASALKRRPGASYAWARIDGEWREAKATAGEALQWLEHASERRRPASVGERTAPGEMSALLRQLSPEDELSPEAIWAIRSSVALMQSAPTASAQVDDITPMDLIEAAMVAQWQTDFMYGPGRTGDEGLLYRGMQYVDYREMATAEARFCLESGHVTLEDRVMVYGAAHSDFAIELRRQHVRDVVAIEPGISSLLLLVEASLKGMREAASAETMAEHARTLPLDAASYLEQFPGVRHSVVIASNFHPQLERGEGNLRQAAERALMEIADMVEDDGKALIGVSSTDPELVAYALEPGEEWLGHSAFQSVRFHRFSDDPNFTDYRGVAGQIGYLEFRGPRRSRGAVRDAGPLGA